MNFGCINDTTPQAARVQIELLRSASYERRAALTRSLSRSVIELSRRALREGMPGATESDVLLRWVALNYGDQLAQRVRAYIEARTEMIAPPALIDLALDASVD